MQLTPGVTISSGESVDRQKIYNLLANAVGGTVSPSDLDTSVAVITSQTSVPTPFPGKLWWDLVDQVMKVYCDVLDGTAVSLWLAIGPDRFDCPMLAGEPLPFGAAVMPGGVGTRVCVLPLSVSAVQALPVMTGIWEPWKVIGFNQGGRAAASDRSTIASGTWFACGIDGFVWTWHPLDVHTLAPSRSSRGDTNWDTLISQTSNTTGPSGWTAVRGGILPSAYVLGTARTGCGLVRSWQAMSRTLNDYWNKQPFFGARHSRL